MGISEILVQIDMDIARLQKARELIAGGSVASDDGAAAASRHAPKKKRNLTPEGRKRIAEAVKRRWAEQKRASSNKGTTAPAR